MPRSRQTLLSVRLALASIASAGAIAGVCTVALFSLGNVQSLTHDAVARQISILNDTSAFQFLLYQKGFVAEYMLTGDRRWLEPLEDSRKSFAAWLERSRAGAASEEARAVVRAIEREYAEYETDRGGAIAAFDVGRTAEAKALLARSYGSVERLLSHVREFGAVGHRHAEASLAASERTTRRLGGLLVGTSILAVLASLVVGFYWARRMARPIYDLRLHVESAAQRTSIEVTPDPGDLDGLVEDVGALVRRLEDLDATLVEQRRRLVQSEKLSAVGELAAKLAHEILNPLTGMKTAVQVLTRRPQPGAGPDDAVFETGVALEQEIGRVSDLVRRLVDYSRPLAPQVEVCPVARLLAQAQEVARSETGRAGIVVTSREDQDLPPLEIDPLLMTQALANVLRNAAQTMPDGGTIDLHAHRATDIGRAHVCITVTDEGPGIAADALPHLFLPFFTTRAKGHGLGLAVSQNIALEHGGRIVARNRADRSGAAFDLWIPLVR
jgi:signal transduction histidine kinase